MRNQCVKCLPQFNISIFLFLASRESSKDTAVYLGSEAGQVTEVHFHESIVLFIYTMPAGWGYACSLNVCIEICVNKRILYFYPSVR